MLRVGEGLGLRCQDVILSWIPGFDQAVLLHGTTKRGTEESVVLTNPLIVQYLRCFYVWRGAWADPTGYFFQTSYSRVRRLIDTLARILGLGEIGFRSHSLRRGGATELLMRGIDFGNILLFGRWRAERAAREYCRKGEVAVLRLLNGLNPLVTSLASAVVRLLPFLWMVAW